MLFDEWLLGKDAVSLKHDLSRATAPSRSATAPLTPLSQNCCVFDCFKRLTSAHGRASESKKPALADFLEDFIRKKHGNINDIQLKITRIFIDNQSNISKHEQFDLNDL